MKAAPAPRLVLTFLTSLAILLPIQAAAPRDELLRLVPDDVAFCLVLQDLRDHLTALADSPLASEFRGSAAGKTLGRSPELAKLGELEKFIKQHLGIDFAQLRDDILGDAMVFAYRGGPPGKPEDEQGLFLVRARNAKTLTNLVDRLNQVQQTFGELKKLEERQHNGVKYFARIEKNQPPTFYLLRGPVLLFAPQEAMLQKAIDRDRQAPSADVEPPSLATHFRQLGADRALLALWINPRAFDAEIKQKATTASPAEAAFLRTFGRYWEALEGVVLSLAATKEAELSLAVKLKPEALSPAARKFLAEAARPSELWPAFPREAIFAAAGRCDVAALVELCGEFLDDDTRRAVRDSLHQSAGPALAKVVHNLVTSFGPDAGTYLAPPSGTGWFPDMLWAVRIRPGTDGKPVEQPLLDALNFFANLAVLDHNSKNEDRLALKAVQQNDIEVKFFVNDKQFPLGLQPAYAIKDGYLIFASSPDVLRRFSARAAKPAESTGEIPLMRLSLAALRSYFKDRRESLVAALAAKNQITKHDAAAQVDQLLAGLQFADAIELVQRPSAGQVILTLRIKPTQPLRK